MADKSYHDDNCYVIRLIELLRCSVSGVLQFDSQVKWARCHAECFALVEGKISHNLISMICVHYKRLMSYSVFQRL